MSAIVCASSGNCGEMFISMWVHKAQKNEVKPRNKPQTLTLLYVLQAIINLAAMVAIIAFIHQNFVNRVSSIFKVPIS